MSLAGGPLELWTLAGVCISIAHFVPVVKPNEFWKLPETHLQTY